MPTDTPDARKVAEEARREALRYLVVAVDSIGISRPVALGVAAIDRAILTARIDEHWRACKMQSRCIRYKNLTHELEALR